MVMATITHTLKKGWSARASGGILLGGDIEGGEESFTVHPGFLVSGQMARLLRPAEGWKPFVSTALSLSFSHSSAGAPDTDPFPLNAIDLRLSLTAGYSLWRFWHPYLSARAFGGPVFWTYQGESVAGSDQHFYQLALGSTFTLPGGIALYLEGAPAGERSLSGGIGFSF